jgi:hypothetical protein
MGTQLKVPWVFKRDGLWHHLGSTSTIDPGGSTAAKIIYGVSEWSDLNDNFAIKNTLLAANINAKIQIIRRYGSTMPASFSSSPGNQDVNQGRISWVSYSGPSINAINSGTEDARLASYFASIPATHKHYVTFLHETNNNKLGSNTAAEFVSACVRIWNSKNANAATPGNVKVGPILTAEPYRNNTYQQYFPSGGQYDFIGVDPYRFARDPNDPNYLPDPKTNSAGTKRTMEYLVGSLPSFSLSEGKPWVVGEFAAHPWPTATSERANWLNQTDAFFKQTNCIAAAYFHSPRGPSGPWLIDRFHVYTTNEGDPLRLTGGTDSISLNAFANIMANNQVAGIT